jgi:hypothetical protein
MVARIAKTRVTQLNRRFCLQANAWPANTNRTNLCSRFSFRTNTLYVIGHSFGPFQVGVSRYPTPFLPFAVGSCGPVKLCIDRNESFWHND